MLTVNLTFNATTRLLTLDNVSTGLDNTVAGTIGDAYSTVLDFTMVDDADVLEGYTASVEFDVPVEIDGHTVVRPFVALDGENKAYVPDYIFAGTKRNIMPIQLVFKRTDGQTGRVTRFCSLNILKLTITNSVNAAESFEPLAQKLGFKDSINSVTYDPQTSTFTFGQIDGGVVTIKLSDLAEDHFEVATYDDLITLSEAENGDTATTLDDGRWYKLYGSYDNIDDWYLMSSFHYAYSLVKDANDPTTLYLKDESGNVLSTVITAGEVNLNGTDTYVTPSLKIYAPTTSGTSGQYLKSSGENHTPVWDDTANLPISTATQNALDGKAPNNHASSNTTYGIGSTSQYGHVKVDNAMSDTSTNPVQNYVIRDFVNSSIGTATANFLGTYDAHDDLGLTIVDSTNPTNQQIATALGTYLTNHSISATNNDYAFVSVNYPSTVDIDEYRRFKYNGTSWAYEYTLNNSSFTQAQWDTINSLITNTSDPKVGVDVKDINAHLGDSKIHVPAETTAGKVLTSNDNGQAGWSVLKTINSGSLIGSGDLGLVDLSTAQTIAGSKTFTYYPCIRVNANSGQGGGGAYTQLNYVDNGGTERAHLRTQIGNAQTIVEMTARKFDGTGGVGMGVYNPESGDGFALAPARSYASGSTTQTASDILTKWHLESDITIGGTKTFTRGTSSGLMILKRVGGDSSSPTTNATLSLRTNTGERGNINNWESSAFISTQMSAVGNSTKYIAVYSNKADNVGWADAPYRTYNASNITDIVTIGSLQASTDVVHTAGAETVGGQKTFTNTPIISSHALILKNGSYAKDLSSTTYTNFADIVINDKNDAVLSQIRTDHLQDNSRRVFLLLERTINSTNYQNRLSLVINSSGDSYVTLPHRSYGSAGNDDVLVKSHLESAIEINGAKTFNENITIRKDTPQVIVKTTKHELGIAPNSNSNTYFAMNDKTGVNSARFQGRYSTSRESRASVIAYNKHSDDTTDSSEFHVYNLYDKIQYMSGPYRTYNASNVNDVVTIGLLDAYTPMVRTTNYQNVLGHKNMTTGLQVATILASEAEQYSTYTWFKVAKLQPTKYYRFTYNISLPYNNTNYMIMDFIVITPRTNNVDKISVNQMAKVIHNLNNTTEYVGVAYDGTNFNLYIKTGVNTHHCVIGTEATTAAVAQNMNGLVTPLTPTPEDPTTYTNYVII